MVSQKLPAFAFSKFKLEYAAIGVMKSLKNKSSRRLTYKTFRPNINIQFFETNGHDDCGRNLFRCLEKYNFWKGCKCREKLL